MTPNRSHGQFHNATVYVKTGEVNRAAAIYRDLLGLPVIFAEPGHIACFSTESNTIALCVHEEEPDHPAGTIELFFWTPHPEAIASRAETVGCTVAFAQMADGGTEPRLRLTNGVDLRLHRREDQQVPK